MIVEIRLIENKLDTIPTNHKLYSRSLCTIIKDYTRSDRPQGNCILQEYNKEHFNDAWVNKNMTSLKSI